MTLAGIDKDKCAQRNRIAARKGIEASPVKFLRSPAPVGSGSTSAVGSLPANDEEALGRINAMLDNGEAPLTADDVFVHYAEAANSNFIPGHFGFMSRRTLKNIASDATTGFAFMNSHRTGGLSSPAELPYGRTFAGRYENMAATENDPAGERAVIGFYMLARLPDGSPVYPNGAGGPSTADMDAGIRAGTIFDVSVGLYGGITLCDVCNAPFEIDGWGDRECGHYPGTTENMSDAEVQAQKARGVTDGCCSYTMDDCHCGETSAVYDGAVPGAGFRMFLAGQKSGKLSSRSVSQARLAFGSLLSKGDLMDKSSITDAITDGLSNVLQAFGLKKGGKFSAEDSEHSEETAEKKAEDKPDPQTEPEAAQEDPVLTAAHASGITTAAQFAALQERAKFGDSYLATQKDESRKLAVAAFGNAPENKEHLDNAHAYLEGANFEQVKTAAHMYRTLAQAQNLMSKDGKAMERKSEATSLPDYANDVSRPEEKPVVVLEPASAIYARRKQESIAK